MNDSQRAYELVGGKRYCRERARFQFTPHGGLGKQSHAGVNLDGPLDRFDIVEFHYDPHLDVVQLQDAVDLAANRQIAVEAYDLLAR